MWTLSYAVLHAHGDPSEGSLGRVFAGGRHWLAVCTCVTWCTPRLHWGSGLLLRLEHWCVVTRLQWQAVNKRAPSACTYVPVYTAIFKAKEYGSVCSVCTIWSKNVFAFSANYILINFTQGIPQVRTKLSKSVPGFNVISRQEDFSNFPLEVQTFFCLLLRGRRHGGGKIEMSYT